MNIGSGTTDQNGALDGVVENPVVLTQDILETATYVRAGSDLVLQTDDGAEIVVDGYFQSTPPPALMASNGAQLSGETVSLLAGPAPLQFAQATDGTEAGGGSTEIGKVQSLTGTATVQRTDGTQTELEPGTLVFRGDVVEVSSQGKLGITFADGSIFSLSNGGTMVLNEMVYDPGGTSNNMLFSLVKGSLGFITGAIAGSGGVEVETPVGVMAIRGTTPIALQLSDGTYAIFTGTDGGSFDFYLSPNLPSGQVLKIAEGQGAYVISSDGSAQNIPLTDLPPGALDGMMNGLQQIIEKQKLDKASNDTGSPDFSESSRFDSIEGEILLIKLSQLLAQSSENDEVDLEPVINGNLPPEFLILDGDTATPLPIPETDGGLIATGTLTVFDANRPDAVTTEVIEVVASGTTAGLGFDLVNDPTLLAMLEVVPGLAEADAGDFNNVDWTFDSGAETFDKLGHDEFFTLTYTVRGTDGPGATDDITFIIVIDGTNDTAEITEVKVIGAVQEDVATVADNPNTDAIEASSYLTDTGSITFFDLDLTDTVDTTVALTDTSTTGPAIPPNLAAALSTAMVLSGDITDASGGEVNGVDWSFALDNDLVQYLAIDETITVEYTITVQDDSGVVSPSATEGEVSESTQTVVVTITGTNDISDIQSVTNPGSLSESIGDSSLQDVTATGSLTVYDVDYSDTLTGQVVGDAVALYNGGLVPTEDSIDVSALINNGALTFDASELSEGLTQTLDYTFSADDVDLDWLREGDTLTLDFTVQVFDGTAASPTETVRITIVGTNDVPVITAATNPANITEILGDSSAQDIAAVTGTITINDQDVGDTLTVTVTGDAVATYNGGALPDATINVSALIASGAISFDPLTSDGEANTINWTYDPSTADLDWLRQGDTLELTYTAQVDDGQGNIGAQDLVITIVGTNDVPAITAATNPANITEILGDSSAQDIAAVTGTITINDQDVGDTLTVTVTGDAVATYNGGALPDDSADTVNSIDVSALIASGAISFDPLTSDGEANTINWTYDPAAADLDWLRQGDTLELTYTAQVDDGQGNIGAQDLVITIVGTNDVPAITAATNPANITEILGDSSAQDIAAVTGTITINDQDVGDTLTVTVTGDAVATYNGGALPDDSADTVNSIDVSALIASGAISFDALTSDGEANTINWTYDPSATDLDWLRQGDTLELTYTAQVDDGQGNIGAQDLVITIVGTNDVPAITAATNPANITEILGDSSAQDIAAVTGTITINDQDVGDTLTVTVTGDAVATYNGGALPDDSADTVNSIDVSALIASGAISFDALSSDGEANTINWTYDPAAADLDWLRQGDTLELTYTAQVDDGQGNVGAQDLVITIVGTNDVPAITAATNPANITEILGDSSAQDIAAVTGTITINDQDVGDTLTVTVTGDAVATYNGGALPDDSADAVNSIDVSALIASGAISFDALSSDGEANTINWTYDPSATDLDWLRQGDTLELTYTAQVDDGQGNIGAQDLVITIVGTNDVPAITAATNPANITEILGDISAVTGTITINDQDVGDTLTVTVTGDAVATYNGGALPPDASIDVSALIASGAISFDALTSDGEANTINWTYDPSTADLDWLRQGDTLELTYTAQVDDGQGNVGAQDLVITIVGTNDVPAITAATNPANITEILGDSSAQDIAAVTGTITINDQDVGDTLTVTVTGDAVATYNGGALPDDSADTVNSIDVSALIASGAISFDALTSDGEANTINWTYDPSATDLDWLRQGDTLELTYTAQVDDGQGNIGAQDLVITIVGTNDVPAITAATNPANITEILGDSSAQDIAAVTGTITINDQDVGDTLTVTVTGDAVATYNGGALPDDSADTVNSIDVSALIASGAVSFDALSSDGEANTINWTYDPAAADLDWLRQGDTLELTYTAQVDDGQGNVGAQDLVITIVGTNDVPAITAATNPANITEILGDSSAQDIAAVTGTITINDQDVGDTLTVTVTGDAVATYNGGALPDATINVSALIASGAVSFDALSSDGEANTINWTYDPAAADLDWLRQGDTLELTYTAQVDDGQGNVGAQDLVITIVGTNDVPAITAATNPANITEILGDSSAQDIAAVTGTITINDQDVGDTLTVTVTGDAVATYNGGALPDDSADTVNSIDVSALIASGAVSFDALSSDGEANTINWTYDPAAADLDWLRQGDTLELTYTAQVDDGQGNVGAQDLVITIVGTNDVPAITAATNPANITEILGDSSAQDIAAVTGTITINDQDVGDTLTVTVTGDAVATYNGGALPDATINVSALIASGAISFDPLTSDGEANTINWTYDPAAADLDWLRQGDTLELTYTAQVDDGQGNIGAQDLVITIVGTNDVPEIIGTVEATVNEDDANPATVNLLANSSDPDTGDDIDTDNVQVSLTNGTWADPLDYTIDDETGNLTFDPNQFNALSGGEQLIYTVNYDVIDSQSGSTTATAEITIAGSNDLPTAVDDTAVTDEDSAVILNLTGNDTDPDANDTLAVTEINGTPIATGETLELTADGATVTLNADGTVTYDPNGEFNSLANGDSTIDSFTYTMTDGTSTDTATVNITVLGGDQFDFVISDFGGFSGNSDAKVLPQFQQTDATVQLEITALGKPQSNGNLPTVNSSANDLGVSSGVSGGRKIGSDPLEPEGLLFAFVSVEDGTGTKSDIRASSFSLQVYTATAATATLLIALDGVVDANGASASLTTNDFTLPSGATIYEVGTGTNKFIVTGLADTESFTIDTSQSGGTGFTFSEVSVVNGAQELNTQTPSPDDTYGGDDFTLGLLGIDFPQYVGGSAADDQSPNLVGTDLDDTIVGFAGADILEGLDGDDLLIGGTGSDILDGGPGGDTMIGDLAGDNSDASADTFVISADTLSGSIDDIIVDYSGSGLDEDIVDLTALLDVAGGTDVTADGYVNVVYDGTDTEIRVDQDGGGDGYETVAVLQNYDSTSDTGINILYNEDGNPTGTDVV